MYLVYLISTLSQVWLLVSCYVRTIEWFERLHWHLVVQNWKSGPPQLALFLDVACFNKMDSLQWILASYSSGVHVRDVDAFRWTCGNLEAGCPLSKDSCSWQHRISQALSLNQPSYNCSSILDTPSGKRTSSFVFQVGPTMDFTYLTRSIHTSFKGCVGMVGGRRKAVLPLLIFSGNAQWFRAVNETVASVIFSYMYYFNTGSLWALVLPPL